MVPRQAKSCLSYVVATARYWRSWQNARSTTLRCLQAVASKDGRAAAFAAPPDAVLDLVRGFRDQDS
jgi:hypothetical protein